MKELDENLQVKIQELIDESDEMYDKDDIDPCLVILDNAWEMLPEPKTDWDESYLISKEIAQTYFCSGNIEKAWDYIRIFIECDNAQRNFGESEFLAGKIAFELQKFEDAKAYFQIAETKSEGRQWKGESDPKYFQFFKRK